MSSSPIHKIRERYSKELLNHRTTIWRLKASLQLRTKESVLRHTLWIYLRLRIRESLKKLVWLMQENKTYPRLIIHGVPRCMTKEDLRSEIIALNLKNVDTSEVKIVYVFPPKKNRKYTNCILEVPPNIRTVLLKEKYVFVNFSACRISDYINVLQCFKCLAFGHCKFFALCGHCAGDHEMMEYQLKNENSICGKRSGVTFGFRQ